MMKCSNLTIFVYLKRYYEKTKGCGINIRSVSQIGTIFGSLTELRKLRGWHLRDVGLFVL